ncbi:MAG: DUF1572 family protein [Ignavibacteria bacterium]|nr:DUF1572 family protein [Ignavibacteria bacterium]
MSDNYLQSVIQQFGYYKSLAEKTFAQVTDEQLLWQFNAESNSIAIIVQHMYGNMLSRWTDFLTTDGEKENRNRDTEFEKVIATRVEMTERWNAGWDCTFAAIKPLTETDLERVILIRAEPHTVVEAINRQLAHYAYHVGQIVSIGKMVRSDSWQSLSIPRSDSQKFNDEKFVR